MIEMRQDNDMTDRDGLLYAEKKKLNCDDWSNKVWFMTKTK